MMAKDPADRYQTCRELLKDLSKVRESVAGVTTTLPGEENDREVVALEEAEEPTTAIRKVREIVYGDAAHYTALLAGVIVGVRRGDGVSGVERRCRAGLGARCVAGEQAVAGRAERRCAGGAALPPMPQREEALRTKAEPYLSLQAASRNPTAGVDASMELAAFYLENNKLDDADKLFTRVENVRQVEQYHILGRLGHAIVLALNNRAKESNDLFEKIFTPPRGDFKKGLGGKSGRDKGGEPREWHEQHPQLQQNPQLKYWLAEAIHYNEKNGIQRRDMPAALLRYADPTAPPK